MSISRMPEYDSVNRNVSSRVRKGVMDGTDITSGVRQFHTMGFQQPKKLGRPLLKELTL